MTISSLIVETLPQRTAEEARELAAREGEEVHGVDESEGKVVVTIEAPGIEESHGIASGFIGIEGVRGVDLVYANFEDENLSGRPAESESGALADTSEASGGE